MTETVAELILGHARRGIVAVYDRHRYGGEIQSAMEAWAARLRTILAGSRLSSDGLTNKNNKRIKALSVV